MENRDFGALLTTFLAAAAIGTQLGGAKEAKAASSAAPCPSGRVCKANPFFQFTEQGFDEIHPFNEAPFQEAPFQEQFFQVVQPTPPVIPGLPALPGGPFAPS